MLTGISIDIRHMKLNTDTNFYKMMVSKIDSSLTNTNTFGKTLIAFRTQIPLLETQVPSQTSSISHKSKYRFSNFCKFDSRIPTQILSISDKSEYSSAKIRLSNRIEFRSRFDFGFDFWTIRTSMIFYLIGWLGLWNITNKINSYQKSDYYYYCGWSLHCCDE